MPNVTVYIRNHIWSRILKKTGGDPLKAIHEVKRMVEEKYGP